MKNNITFRKSLGYSQFELAFLLRVQQNILSQYEKGQCKLPAHAVKLLAALKADIKPPKMLPIGKYYNIALAQMECADLKKRMDELDKILTALGEKKKELLKQDADYTRTTQLIEVLKRYRAEKRPLPDWQTLLKESLQIPVYLNSERKFFLLDEKIETAELNKSYIKMQFQQKLADLEATKEKWS